MSTDEKEALIEGEAMPTAMSSAFFGEADREVIILSDPISSGFFAVKDPATERYFVHHTKRLTPTNEAARKMLGKP